VAVAQWMVLLVVPRGGRTNDIAGLMKLYDGAVAKWWLPDAVVVVDELPYGANGKLSKLVLRQKYT
jgi:acyl-CoA synthetase (AMP-forming)/AMP-acid ligase II